MIRKLIFLVCLGLATFSLASAKSNPFIEDPEAEWGYVASPSSIESW